MNKSCATYNQGIDLLRIVAMFMILILHILGQGGILKNLVYVPSELLSKYGVVWLIETICFVATNCFALITGWNCYGLPHKWKRLVELWVLVLFYSIGITVMFTLFGYHTNTYIWIKSFFPVLYSNYWYVTAYVGMFLFIPMMNKFICNTEYKTLRNILICGYVIFCILPTLFNVDPFRLHKGHSVLWLCCLYIVGGVFRKYEINYYTDTMKELIIFSGAILVSWGTKMVAEYCRFYGYIDIKNSNIFINDTSPTIVIASIFLLFYFSKLRFGRNRISSFIKFFSTTSFSIYLIHLHFLVWRNIIKNFAVDFTNYNSLVIVIRVILTAGAMYLMFSLIDWIRLKIFQYINIKEKIDKCATYVRIKLLI